MADSLASALSVGSDDAVIIPGTTPTITFTIDSELLSSTEYVRLDVTQQGMNLIQSYDNTIQGNTVIHRFTQEETYQFIPGIIRLQLHGITDDDIAWKSKIVSLNIGETLSHSIVHNPNEEINGGE